MRSYHEIIEILIVLNSKSITSSHCMPTTDILIRILGQSSEADLHYTRPASKVEFPFLQLLEKTYFRPSELPWTPFEPNFIKNNASKLLFHFLNSLMKENSFVYLIYQGYFWNSISPNTHCFLNGVKKGECNFRSMFCLAEIWS